MSSYTPIQLAFDVFEPQKRSNGYDIILIHGITSSRVSWYETAPKLADESGCKVFALDMRNHGDSGWSDLFNCEVAAKDVVNFMDEQSIKTAIFIGHSLGGRISMNLALTRPEKVTALIVEDISPGVIPKDAVNDVVTTINVLQECLLLLPPDMDIETALQFVAKEILKRGPKNYRSTRASEDKLTSKFALTKKGDLFSWKMNTGVLKKYLLNVIEHDTMEGVCPITSLFLYGNESHLNVFNDTNTILKMFPNAQLCEFENATHRIHTEYPEKFCRVILQFLKDKNVLS